MTSFHAFAGIGAHAHGFARAGVDPVGFCECDPFCRAVLTKNFPSVQQWDRIQDVTANAIRDRLGYLPDCIEGGVPCQPASVAGRRKGAMDDRWLWPEFVRLVLDVSPGYFVAENVRGFLSLDECDGVFVELAKAGYEIGAWVLGAEHVGAPHRRHRCWIVGKLADTARDEQSGQPASERANGERTRQSSQPVGNSSCTMAITREPRLAQRCERASSARTELAMPSGFRGWPARPGENQHEWEESRLITFQVGEPVAGASSGLVRVADRDAERTARYQNKEALRALGNANPPQTAYAVARAILEQS